MTVEYVISEMCTAIQLRLIGQDKQWMLTAEILHYNITGTGPFWAYCCC